MRMHDALMRTAVAIASCCALFATDAAAQTYPTKPLRLVVGASAGAGAGDISARLLAQKLSENLGQNVVVENRPGAGGAIADEAVARAPADGYTLLYTAGSSAILPALRGKLPYDIERDLAPVSLAVLTSFALATHPSVPAREVKALIALARAQPGKLIFGSPGVGSSAHFAGELFNMMARVKMLHVPYKGAPEANTAVVAGHTDVAFASVTAALSLIRAGRLNALAVTSATRSPLLSTVPTLDEAGIAGYQRSGWNGVMVPAGVPKDIVARLNAAVVKSLNAPETREAFAKLGLDGQPGTPEQFAAFLRNELAQNAKVVRFAGIRVE